MPHINFKPLIVNMPHTKECAACGMDDSMEHDIEICPTCHKCLRWEDEFGAGTCCTCHQDAANWKAWEEEFGQHG
jgi:hypothetical protein